jgi:hypothetical protein
MKKIIAIATLVAATSASAGFFNNSNGSNDFGPFNGSNNWASLTTLKILSTHSVTRQMATGIL